MARLTFAGSVGGGLRGFWSGLLARKAGGVPVCEALEPRVLLSDAPFPSISLLENANNAVVRIDTAAGDVDIEMFGTDAPNTVANFLRYVTTGRFDDVFFHRMTKKNQAGQGIDVIQGGGFLYQDNAGPSQIQNDAAINLEGSTRTHAAGTIAMARTDDFNSATGQFFFNVTDNSATLKPGSPQVQLSYVVFGRVIQGFDVLQQIFTSRIIDARTDPAFTGSLAGVFGEVPVTATYTQLGGIRETSLWYIRDAEVIKPSGANGFYDKAVVYPEGHRTSTSTETVDLFNPNDASALYDVLVRYENGLRDVSIASGTLAAGASLTLPISVAGQAAPNLVRENTPYSIIVRTSVPTSGATTNLPITAVVQRNDFFGSTVEGAFDPSKYTDAQLRTWGFARVERGDLSREYLTWVNLSDTDATITAVFSNGVSANRTFTFKVDAWRRGGVQVFSLGLDTGVYAVRLSSTERIVAMLSDYDIPSGGVPANTAYTPAWAMMGVPDGGQINGVLSNVRVDSNFVDLVSFDNPGSTVAVITLRAWRTDRAATDPPIQGSPIILSPGQRRDYTLGTLLGSGLPENERFTLTYETLSAKVVAHFTSVSPDGRNQASVTKRDGIGSTLALATGTRAILAGSIDPTRDSTTQSEILSIFNPFSNSTIAFSYTAVARFSDGTEVDLGSGTLTTNGRRDIAIDGNAALRAKANSGANFRTYALVVRGTATQLSSTLSIAPMAQVQKRDTATGQEYTYQPVLAGSFYSYNSSLFTPGGVLP